MCGLAIASPAHGAPVPGEVPIAMLVDMASGQTLYARNPDRRFVPASITKVMTAYTAFELMKQGKLAPGTRFTFSEAAADEWYRTGSTMFLDRGSETAVTDLLMGITTVSANDGSIVLAEGAAGSVDNWLDLMNAHADALGMHQSHFGTPNGWPDEGRTFTTARDLVTLAKALITEHPGCMHATLAIAACGPMGLPRIITTRLPAVSRAQTGSRQASPTRQAGDFSAAPNATVGAWSWSSPPVRECAVVTRLHGP